MVEFIPSSDNWLFEQLDELRQTANFWPEWKKREYALLRSATYQGHPSTSSTAEQRGERA